MAIGFSPEPKELKFHALDYANTEAIQGLIRFYFGLKSDLDYKPNMEIVSVLADIANAIKNSGLTDKQKMALKLYMEGWTEEEIAQKQNITQQAVNKHIKLICKKLSNHLTK